MLKDLNWQMRRRRLCFPLVPRPSHSPCSPASKLTFFSTTGVATLGLLGVVDEGREGGLVPLQLLVFLYSSIFPISSVQTCVPDT